MNVDRMRLLAAVAAAAAWVVAGPAYAQQILASAPVQHDKARLSGFLWRGKPQGSLGFDQLADFPGFEDGVDVTDILGFDESNNGWILEGNFAPGRKHHIILELARMEASGSAAIEIPSIPPFPGITVNTASTIDLREFHAFYNYLFVARPQVEFGMLVGVGWFDADAQAVAAGIGSARAGIDQAFPTFGGNVMINPRGPVRGYFELTGFPRIEIEELSGWQLDLAARLEVFVVRNFGLMFGYRRYQLVFDHDGEDIAIDLTWNGFTIGAQARF